MGFARTGGCAELHGPFCIERGSFLNAVDSLHIPQQQSSSRHITVSIRGGAMDNACCVVYDVRRHECGQEGEFMGGLSREGDEPAQLSKGLCYADIADGAQYGHADEGGRGGRGKALAGRHLAAWA